MLYLFTVLESKTEKNIINSLKITTTHYTLTITPAMTLFPNKVTF